MMAKSHDGEAGMTETGLTDCGSWLCLEDGCL